VQSRAPFVVHQLLTCKSILILACSSAALLRRRLEKHIVIYCVLGVTSYHIDSMLVSQQVSNLHSPLGFLESCNSGRFWSITQRCLLRLRHCSWGHSDFAFKSSSCKRQPTSTNPNHQFTIVFIEYFVVDISAPVEPLKTPYRSLLPRLRYG